MARLAALLLLLLAPAAARAADVEFVATTDRDEIGLDDTVTLTVTVGVDAGSGGRDVEDLKLPDPPDFEVISRSKSQQMSFAMGHGGPPTFRKVSVYTLLLQPRRTGTLTIPSGRLAFGGKTYETGALRIKVAQGSRAPRRPAPAPVPQPQPGQPPPNPFGALGGLFGGADDPDAQEMLDEFFGASRPASDSDLYLRAYLDKKQAYLGEQVTFSVYLFSRVDISGVDGFKMPKLDGFWAEDLETPQQITGDLKMIDGVPYRVFLLRKRALFPLKAGKLAVESVEVDVSTGFGLVLSGRKLHRATQPTSLEVLPLPAGAPPGFETPNVGQWRLSADALPTSVPLGQPITLKLTLEGHGNLHDVVTPRLPALPGLRAYDPTINEKTTTARARFGGKRVLEYLLMPEQSGTFEIPALTLQYFDPASATYAAATTQPLTLRVEAGPGGPSAPVGPTAVVGPNGPRAVNVLDQGGLRALRYKGDLARPAPPLYRQPFFLPVALAPFALWLGLAVAGLVRTTLRPSAEGVQRGLAGKARKRLRRAKAQLKAKDPDAFYAEVSHALEDYLAARLGSPVAGLTRPDLAARLTASGLPPRLLALLTSVLDTCDAGRFAPGGSDPATMGKVLDGAASVMEGVDGVRLSPPPAPEAQA